MPIAFPLIAGAGTLTTILSIRAVYEEKGYPYWNRIESHLRLYRTSVKFLVGTENWKIGLCCFTESIWSNFAFHCSEDFQKQHDAFLTVHSFI